VRILQLEEALFAYRLSMDGDTLRLLVEAYANSGNLSGAEKVFYNYKHVHGFERKIPVPVFRYTLLNHANEEI
jgi:hypothetical protein